MPALVPLKPNWRDNYSVTYAYKTEILTTRSGKEQRRALRSTPRKTLEFLGSYYGSNFQTFMAAINRQGDLVTLPEIPAGVFTTASSATGQNAFTPSSIPPWAAVGRNVVVIAGIFMEVRTIQQIVGGQIKMTANNTVTWPTKTLIAPALNGRLSEDTTFNEILPSIMEGSVTFNVNPGSETLINISAAPLVWNGREVFLPRHNWKNAPATKFSKPLEVVDNDYGVITTFQPVSFATQIRPVDCTMFTPAAVTTVVDFFHRCKGRRGEFYCPTDRPEIVPNAIVAAGDTTFFTAGLDLYNGYGGDTSNKQVSILLKDGTRFFREITSITSSGANTRIILGNGMQVQVDPAKLQAMCFMPLCRHASDEITVDWSTMGVAEVRLNIQTLEAMPLE